MTWIEVAVVLGSNRLPARGDDHPGPYGAGVAAAGVPSDGIGSTAIRVPVAV
jgi:hypothetical protein